MFEYPVCEEETDVAASITTFMETEMILRICWCVGLVAQEKTQRKK